MEITVVDVALFCWAFFPINILLSSEKSIDKMVWIPLLICYCILFVLYRKIWHGLKERFPGANSEIEESTLVTPLTAERERIHKEDLAVTNSVNRELELASIISDIDSIINDMKNSPYCSNLGTSSSTDESDNDAKNVSSFASVTTGTSSTATADESVTPNSISKEPGYETCAETSKCSDKELKENLSSVSQPEFFKLRKQNSSEPHRSEKTREDSNDSKVTDLHKSKDNVPLFEKITEISFYHQVNESIVKEVITVSLTSELSAPLKKSTARKNLDLSSSDQEEQKVQNGMHTEQKLSLDTVPHEFIYPCIFKKH